LEEEFITRIMRQRVGMAVFPARKAISSAFRQNVLPFSTDISYFSFSKNLSASKRKKRKSTDLALTIQKKWLRSVTKTAAEPASHANNFRIRTYFLGNPPGGIHVLSNN
jgi:hypothetical protein